MLSNLEDGAVGYLLAEPSFVSEQNVLAEFYLKPAEQHSFCRHLASPCFLTVLLGFILMALTCSHARIRQASPGVEPRQLANGGNEADESLPPFSPEIEILCWAAENWSPTVPLRGEPRSSPEMVEAFFEVLRVPESSQPGALSERAGQGDNDEAGTSSEPLRLASVHQPLPSSSPPLPRLSPQLLEELFTAIEQPCESSFDQPSLQPGDRKHSSSLQPQIGPAIPSEPFVSGRSPVAPYPSQTHECHVPVGLLPVSSDEPSTSTASPPPAAVQQSLSQDRWVHPYVRLPTVQPGVTPRPWRRHVVTSYLMHERSSRPLLLEMRKLLLQPDLGANGVEKLMTNAELLANFAIKRLKKRCISRKPCEMVRDRGLRFMIMNTLHSAAQVVSPRRPPWWGDVADATLTDLSSPSSSRPDAFNMMLARDLTTALEKYKAGGAPLPEDVISIKRRLFLSKPYLPSAWNPWREDDAQGSRR